MLGSQTFRHLPPTLFQSVNQPRCNFLGCLRIEGEKALAVGKKLAECHLEQVSHSNFGEAISVSGKPEERLVNFQHASSFGLLPLN